MKTRKQNRECECGNPGTIRCSGGREWVCQRCRELERQQRNPKRKEIPSLFCECGDTVRQVARAYDAWVERRGLDKTSTLNFGSLK
jgi:hypothetical protein